MPHRQGATGEKYRKMLSAARKYLSDVAKYGQPNGGVSLWVELPVGVGAEALCSRMLEKNVILTPAVSMISAARKPPSYPVSAF